MKDISVILSIIWIAVMLTYLLGDVIRIFTGDMIIGELNGTKFTQGMSLAIATMMVIPILMVILALFLPQNINRWVNIIIAAAWFLLNLIGIPSYAGRYDQFLLAVSMVFNAITIWFAWNWV